MSPDRATTAEPATPTAARSRGSPPGQGDREDRSFAKALFLGRIEQGLVTPYPVLDTRERGRVHGLIADLRDLVDEVGYDPRQVEAERWIGDRMLAGLGELGLTGLYVDERYGGHGLSQTGYARVSEEFGRVDASLAVVMGVHQSIGYKGLHLFGTEEQKQRYLPDLAAGRKLAGFALTEPEAGSDAYHLTTRAERQADGTWVLNGEKRWIGNGGGDLLTVFARSPEHGHVALLVEGGWDGVDAPHRYDTMGLRANDLRRVVFSDVRVPDENVLGAPGEGFSIAMEVLNNGRMSLGTGAVGAIKTLLELAVGHVRQRHQFGRPLSDFELVEEKISWMTSYAYGLESLSYLTTGLVDAGVQDVALESAMVKVAATEFLWYAANRAFQLAGGEAYMRTAPYEKILRDIRVFPIFEGANDVLRSFIALTGLQVLGEQLQGYEELDLLRPVRSAGVVLDYVVDRIRSGIDPPRMTRAHPELEELAEPLTGQVQRLRSTAEEVLRLHRSDVVDRQWQQKRLAHAAMDIAGQVATLSRLTALLHEQGVEASGTERYIADTFCTRAARRVRRNLDHVEDNDDDRMHAIARVTYRQGGYGFGLFD